MTYVTTNIRISEEDYLRLKSEAAGQRKSFSAVVREKIVDVKEGKQKSPQKLLNEIRKHAKESEKYLEGTDSMKIIRGIRDNAKW